VVDVQSSSGNPANTDLQDIDSWTPPRFLRRHAQRAQRRRRLRRFLLWSIGALLVWGFVFAEDGVISLGLRSWKIRQLQHEVDRLEARRVALRDEIRRRREDARTIERLAREEYGMIFPGERVVRIRPVEEAEARRFERSQLHATTNSRTQPPAP
jgi:cell division protein FtsB